MNWRLGEPYVQIEYSLLDSMTLSAGFAKYFSITANFESSILQKKKKQQPCNTEKTIHEIYIYMDFTASPYL